MNPKNRALICIYSELISGTENIKKIISGLGGLCQIEAISNIYKQQKNKKQGEFNSELCLVLKIETEFNQEDLASRIVGLIERLNQKHKSRIIILTFNDFVWLRPDLPIPHPVLIEQPVVLKCAIEVWDSYEHPILGMTLNEVMRKQEVTPALEFFAQGKALLP